MEKQAASGPRSPAPVQEAHCEHETEISLDSWASWRQGTHSFAISFLKNKSSLLLCNLVLNEHKLFAQCYQVGVYLKNPINFKFLMTPAPVPAELL